ncbi:MAG: hypothetical protein ACFCUL_14985 [Flavobacteriaceae bacterium]
MLPRFGVNISTEEEYRQVEWYGMRYHENFDERKTWSRVSKYTSSVANLFVPNIRTQENGNRTDIRSLKFTLASEKGIEIFVPERFGFSAHHQLNDDFDPDGKEQKRHTFAIKKRTLVNLNIDYRQMGVGGDNRWGNLPMEKYQIKPENLSYSYVILPIW